MTPHAFLRGYQDALLDFLLGYYGAKFRKRLKDRAGLAFPPRHQKLGLLNIPTLERLTAHAVPLGFRVPTVTFGDPFSPFERNSAPLWHCATLALRAVAFTRAVEITFGDLNSEVRRLSNAKTRYSRAGLPNFNDATDGTMGPVVDYEALGLVIGDPLSVKLRTHWGAEPGALISLSDSGAQKKVTRDLSTERVNAKPKRPHRRHLREVIDPDVPPAPEEMIPVDLATFRDTDECATVTLPPRVSVRAAGVPPEEALALRLSGEFCPDYQI